MLYRKFGVLFGLTLAVLMAACAPAAGSQEEDEPQPTSEVTDEPTEAVEETAEPTQEGLDTIPHPAVLEAQKALAEELGIDMAEIEIVMTEAVEWSDSCLGLGGPAESCLQAITPGWRITLRADGVDYEVHTDETGTSVRIAENLEQ